MAQVASGQGPVEARSLSSITAIASNPPAYPRNPTQQPLDPLVLYIVRVPGSRGKDRRFSFPSTHFPPPPTTFYIHRKYANETVFVA